MNVKIQHSLASFAAIAIALIALFAMIQPAVAADANTLRLYGEDGYSAAFPYNDPEGPFDPLSYDAPMKDFVTFNPALMEDRIVVDQVDSKQKVFVRQWFVPELYEPVGEVWLEEPNMYVSEDVVTEYTYMFVDKHYEPVEGTVESPTGALWTKFWFPVADNSDDQIGLDGFDINGDGVDDMTNLFAVGDFNADGRKDVALASDTYKLAVGEELQFLDHKIVVEDLGVISNDPAISIVVDVYYTGNDEDELIADNYMATIYPGEFVSAGRHTVIKDAPTFTEPWFLEAEAVGSDSVYVRVGRLLHTGETFFVDAAEYDVAMIFGTYPDSVKYITIRNPVPEHYDINLEDLSVIKLSVADCEYVPLLPPLNMVHTMVDDINIPEYADHYTTCFYPNSDDNTQYIDYRYDTVEERKIYDVAPLKIYFTGKDIEERFHTNLLEILDEDCVEGEESWDWLHIRTMPDFYKDFVYPALPDIDDGYGDFIVTSSFEAPNSDLCLIEEPCDPNNFDKNQRVMFVYDQDEGAEDLYVNEYNNMSALRLYGENGYSAAFPYTDPEAPFDPLNPEAPVKDFVTLPPALIKAGIVVDQVDSKEKVFMRQWFVPELPEPVGKVWLEEPNIYVSEDVVSEYTYMFVDKHFNPTEGSTLSPTGALWTKFWLPVADNDDNQIGLDGYDVNGDGVDDMVWLLDINDIQACGQKDIAIGTDTYQLQVGDELQFLDHKVIVKDVSVISNDPAISLVVDVYYTGNDVPELIYQNFMATILPGEYLSAGRHTVIKDAPTFTEPWFMEAVASNTDDNVYIRVGRLLHTGETFFVDAAEYDIPMIFGGANQTVKYITIRNPVPEHYDINLEDLSVIKLSVADNEIVPVLPPFNKVHNMIDDIDPAEFFVNHYTTCYYDDNTDVGSRVIEEVAPLEIFFTGKDIEPRFHTNLLEILDEPCIVSGVATTSQIGDETWKWLHIRTMPDFYKEFVYPDLPNLEDNDPDADYDYLVTLSWTAPNSDFCDSSIIGDQRLMFGHDPLDGTGLYMNQDEVCGTVVVKGDFNGDDIVDFMDFLDFVDAYDSAEGDENYDAVADFNDDGVVDFMDFLDFVDAYNA